MLNKDPTAAGVCEKFIFFERIMWVTKAGCFIKSRSAKRERERGRWVKFIFILLYPLLLRVNFIRIFVFFFVLCL